MNDYMKQSSNEYISLGEAADNVGMNQDFFRTLCLKGRLKGKKIGKIWVTTMKWVHEYLDSRSKKNIPKKYRKNS